MIFNGKAEDRFIGLMSGTSLDGVDAVLVQFPAPQQVRVLGRASLPYPVPLRQALLRLQENHAGELHQAACVGNQLATLYAEVVEQLLDTCQLSPSAIKAIACHGQTIRHAPEHGYTLQIGNPALLAELSGIDVVADFRSRDIAAGGQGAPLVPAFHAAVFAHPQQQRVVANIGGIANISILSPNDTVLGFDTGPGNMLLDAWIQQQRGLAWDEGGQWASQGQVLPDVLHRLLAEPYFSLPPPKSTGRDLFSLAWLQSMLSGTESAVDVQATLLALTVESLSQAIERHATESEAMFVCGGGAYNHALMAALQQRLAPRFISTTATLGIPEMDVEAVAFAWLGQAFFAGDTGNLPAVTGARGPRRLGAYYPA